MLNVLVCYKLFSKVFGVCPLNEILHLQRSNLYVQPPSPQHPQVCDYTPQNFWSVKQFILKHDVELKSNENKQHQ